MEQCKIGTMIKSMAGHDKDNILIIISKEDEYVYLVDGKRRTLEKPKKKKILHIEVTEVQSTEFVDEVEKHTINDARIRKIIKNAKTLHKCLA